MKKLLPLMASLLLLGACSTTDVPDSKPKDTSEQSIATSVDTHFLTFLEDGEIYVDLNFDNAPAGLSIKIGDTTLTASGKATMTKDFAFEVAGTFVNPINIYSVVDANGVKGVGKGEGFDAEIAKNRIEQYLGNYSRAQSGNRVYFCLSDKANGWSKTLPGVDEAIKSYSGLK